jgi:hypothetical protein
MLLSAWGGAPVLGMRAGFGVLALHSEPPAATDN